VPLDTLGWNYGKYGKNYVSSAEKLHVNGIFIERFYNSIEFSYGRKPDFNERATQNVLRHWSGTWRDVNAYYNANVNNFDLWVFNDTE
jgi:hypothetical protein